MQLTAIGVPNYTQGSKYPKRNYFRIKDGDNFYRILPPFGTLAEKGAWMQYAASHWVVTTKGKRPIACPQDKDPKTKMVRVRCPICDEVARRSEMATAHAETLQGEAQAAFKKMYKDWEFQYGRNGAYFVNALNREGQIGQLEIRTKHKQALLPVIKELSDGGLDPIGMGGVELNFFRSGKGNETSHQVSPAVDKISLTEQRLRLSPLTDEIIKRMATEAFELTDLFRVLTAAELKRIVDADFSPEVTELVLNAPKTDAATQAAGDDDNDDPSDIPSYKPNGFVPTVTAPVQSPAQPVQQAPATVAPQAPVGATLGGGAPQPLVSVATDKTAFMALFAPKS